MIFKLFLFLIILFIVFFNTPNLPATELTGVCASRISQENHDGNEVYLMKKAIEIDSKYKGKDYKIELNISQLEHIVTFYFKFDKKICIEKESNLIINFVDGDSKKIKSKSTKKNCEGDVIYSISHLLDYEISSKILENEITSMQIELKGEKVSLDISEFALATIKFNYFCFEKIFKSQIE